MEKQLFRWLYLEGRQLGLNLTEEELYDAFRREFTALAAYYKVSAKPLLPLKNETGGESGHE